MADSINHSTSLFPTKWYAAIITFFTYDKIASSKKIAYDPVDLQGRFIWKNSFCAENDSLN